MGHWSVTGSVRGCMCKTWNKTLCSCEYGPREKDRHRERNRQKKRDKESKWDSKNSNTITHHSSAIITWTGEDDTARVKVKSNKNVLAVMNAWSIQDWDWERWNEKGTSVKAKARVCHEEREWRMIAVTDVCREIGYYTSWETNGFFHWEIKTLIHLNQLWGPSASRRRHR